MELEIIGIILTVLIVLITLVGLSVVIIYLLLDNRIKNQQREIDRLFLVDEISGKSGVE